MEKRLAEMTFAPLDSLVVWLAKILVNGSVAIEQGDVVVFYNHDLNFRGGFCYHSDPVTKGVMIASAIAGAYWVFAFPNLLEEINKEWDSRKKRNRQ